MPIIDGKKYEEIERAYVSNIFDDIIIGSLLQLGFRREDFKKNQKYKDFITHHEFIEGSLVTSLILEKDTIVFDRLFKSGTRFRFTTSWKPTLSEFKNGLEKDFIIKKVFHNKDMAIALVESIRE